MTHLLIILLAFKLEEPLSWKVFKPHKIGDNVGASFGKEVEHLITSDGEGSKRH